MLKKVVAALGLSIAMTTPAFAQDQCNDVLRDGVFNYNTYRDDSYFNQIVWSRFLRTNFESSKTDRGGGFGVPIGEIVLGANYTEEQYNKKREQIQREYFNQITASREIDVALMSGDEEVLRAWSGCMASRGGGLTARFEPLSPLDVNMVIEYFSEGNKHSVRLERDVVLPPGIEVRQNPHCLRRGRRIERGDNCVAVLRLASALTTIPVAVDPVGSDTATAWLPARIQLSREQRPYSFSAADRLYDWAHKRTQGWRRDVALSEEQLKEGWLFDPSTARTGLHVISVNNSRNNCHSEWSSPTSTTFSYGYTIYAGNRRRRDGHIECAMNPYIMMRRDVWVAMQMPEGQVSTGGSMNALIDQSPDSVAARRSIFSR